MSLNKTSANLENSEPATTAERLLLRLKLGGPQRAAELGAQLGIGGEAARQQLTRLAAQGLVAALPEVGRVGRPHLRWRLTEAGNRRFPDAHAEMTVQLIQTIRAALGEEVLERVIADRAQATLAAYLAEIAMGADLPTRLAQLAAIRTREGYMAEWYADGAGYVLVEHHCPICAAARACQAFCRNELELFQAALGPGVRVQRTAHMLADESRCAYRITLL